MVALLLIGLIYTVANTDTFTSERQKMDEALTDLERAVRFSVDEAALRNTMVRVHFFLDKVPQEYAVEYGPDDNFVVPASAQGEEASNLREEEVLKKEREATNKKFNRVREFEESNKQLPEGVTVVGLGTSLTSKMMTEGEASLYVYPTGERDEAIIGLANEQEVATLQVDAFLLDFKRQYLPLGENGNFPTGQELEDKRMELVRREYDKWFKEGVK